jgi:ribosomal protein L13E
VDEDVLRPATGCPRVEWYPKSRSGRGFSFSEEKERK